MPSFPKSRRDQVAEAKRGNDFVHAMYHDLGAPKIAYPPEKPKRERRAPDPNAPPLERDVLKAVWKYLNHHPKVAWVTRIQSGAAMMDFGADGVHPMHFNRKRGMADLLGQLKDGRILCCECKREGAALMDHQREFLNEVIRHNGVAFVARCIEDAEKALATS